MFKVNNKDNRTTSMRSFLVSLLLISNTFHISQVNVCWDVSACSIARLEGIYLSPCLALNEKKKFKKNL